jgi:hypothetical protein
MIGIRGFVVLTLLISTTADVGGTDDETSGSYGGEVVSTDATNQLQKCQMSIRGEFSNLSIFSHDFLM